MDEPKGTEPQKNYFKVKNDWWDALAAYRIPGEPMQCLLVIIRQTYGYKRRWAFISFRFIAKKTGLSKRSVERAIKWLLDHKICVRKKADSQSVSYSFNKYKNTWLSVRKKADSPQKSGHTVRNNADGSVRKKADTHLLKTKDTFKNKRTPQKRGFGEPPNYKAYKSSEQREGRADISVLIMGSEILKDDENKFQSYCRKNKLCQEDINLIREQK